MTVSDLYAAENAATVHVPVCRRMRVALGRLYCRCFHESISWPVAGKYYCWDCLREFTLHW